MKDWSGGSYIFLKITPRVPGSIPLVVIEHKYNYRKVLGFIATEGGGSTERGDPYLSSFPGIYFNVSVCPVVHPQLIVRYFNACNAIDSQNMMQKSDLAPDKYWLT